MRVSVLGQLAVTDGGGEPLPAGELPRRARQVLSVLAVRHGRTQSKDALADAVWGEDLPNNHVAALEHYVSVVRRRLQPSGSAATWFIVTRSGGYLFDTARAGLDLADLRELVRDLDALAPGGEKRLAVQEEILRLARELPFPEDPYESWTEGARTEVQAAAVEARLELAVAALPTDGARSLRLASEAIELNPFLEPAYKVAMRAAVATDRPDDALRVFDRCRRVLDEELGVAPSDELVRLHRRIVGARRQSTVAARGPVVRRPIIQERFIGRTPELLVFLQPNPPRVAHVVGPVGAGKSAFLAELGRHLIGRVGVGRAGPTVGVHRLAWLHAALAQVGAADPVLAAVDAAEPEQPLDRERLVLIGGALAGAEPLFLCVDDAADLDATSVAELSWLLEHYPELRLVLTYCYPSHLADRPIAGLGTPVVLRLEPLTDHDLAVLGDDALPALTGGIPALVAVARRPHEYAVSVAMQTARARTRWMPEPAWDVLRYCAVLGDLGAADLATLTGCPVDEVLTAIDRLDHARLLRGAENGLVGHRSSLIREAVADQVSAASALHLKSRLNR